MYSFEFPSVWGEVCVCVGVGANLLILFQIVPICPNQLTIKLY